MGVGIGAVREQQFHHLVVTGAGGGVQGSAPVSVGFGPSGIGAAFQHQDGDGFNVVLQALPINGKIVLRLPKAQEEKPQEQPANPKRRDTRRP